jgi:hypothetical protein
MRGESERVCVYKVCRNFNKAMYIMRSSAAYTCVLLEGTLREPNEADSNPVERCLLEALQ